MLPIETALLEQMRVTPFDVESRMRLIALTPEELAALARYRPIVERQVDAVIRTFHRLQADVPEMAALLGDVDTRRRLQDAQRKYVLDLFAIRRDVDYVNSRLRIGLVHGRLGVAPPLYLAAVRMLRTLLVGVLEETGPDDPRLATGIAALDKLIAFDVALVIEAYVRRMTAEVESAKRGVEQYARRLELRIAEQAEQLWIDPLTGATNRRFLVETLQQRIRAAERRSEPLSLVFIDVDRFKAINDTQGHQRGDDVLKQLATILRAVGRSEDACFRFGGDEFCVILANCTAAEARKTYCVRLRKLVTEQLGGVTVSTGVTQTGPDAYEDPEVLISRADQHMYDEKGKPVRRDTD